MTVEALHQIYFSVDERLVLDQKFSTLTKSTRIKKIKEYLLSVDSEIKTPVAEQIKEQQLLSLKLKNQIMLIHNLKFPISKTIEIIANPDLIDTKKDEATKKELAVGLLANGYCASCEHNHFVNHNPKVCENYNCNCGVRG